MNTQITDVSETRKIITLTFTGEETAAEAQSVMNEFRQHARIRGFRPGRAPDHAILKQFGKRVADEIDNQIITKARRSILDDESLKIYSFVDIAGSGFRGGQEATVQVTVDVNPSFDLPQYKGLKVKIAPVSVTDEEVQGTFDRLLRNRAEFEQTDRAAAAGDYVKVSYEGKIGDELVSGLLPDHPLYGTQKSTWEEAGAKDGYGVPAVVNGVIGMKAGDSKVVEETFAEDFPVEGLRGKTVSYSVAVEEVREVKLPQIDEEFCKAYGAENEEKLRESIRQNIQQQKERAQNSAKRSQIIQQLIDPLEIPLPESALEAESQQLLRDFMERQIQSGVSQEQLEARSEELIQGAAAEAARQIKLQMVLFAIAAEEKIEVQEEELKQIVWQQAMQSGMPIEKYLKEFQKDSSSLYTLRRNALLGKTLDFVVDAADVTEEEGAGEAVASTPAG